MTIHLLIKFLHILSALWVITGVVGRQIVRSQARQTGDLQIFLSLDALASRFENAMVRPGSTAIIVSGVVLALVQGWPILGFLQGSPINWLLISILLIVGLLLVIVLIFLPRGREYAGILQEAVARGEITPELLVSFDDPVVRWAHRYEEVALLVIILLMVTKPF